MQVSTRARRSIAAPPEVVFALALDPAAFPDLFGGFGPVPAVRKVSMEGPPRIGAVRQLENSDGSRPRERILAFDPPRLHRYALEGLRAPLSWLASGGIAEWRFTPAGEGTCVEWRYDVRLTSALAWPLAWPVVRFCMGEAMRRCLAAMDARLGAGEARG